MCTKSLRFSELCFGAGESFDLFKGYSVFTWLLVLVQVLLYDSLIQCGPIKNMPLYFCLYLRQLLTDFQNSFTGALCGQFALM